MSAEVPRKRTWLAVSGYLLAIAALYFSARYLQVNLGTLRSAALSIEAWRVLAAVCVFGLHLLLNALAFAALCHGMGQRTGPRLLAGAWTASLLAKYVPGGVWQLVGRGMLLARFGMGARDTAMTGIVEQVISLGACTAIGIGALCWVYGHAIAGGAFLLLALLAIWRLSDRLARKTGERRRRSISVSLAGYTMAMLPYAVGYALLVSPPDAARFLSSLFLGTVAGVLAIPVPGGIGIRESVIALLDPAMEPSRLLAGLLIARLAMFVAESIATVVGYFLLRKGITP